MKVYTLVSRETSTDDPEKAKKEEEIMAYSRFENDAANEEYEYEGTVTEDKVGILTLLKEVMR